MKTSIGPSHVGGSSSAAFDCHLQNRAREQRSCSLLQIRIFVSVLMVVMGLSTAYAQVDKNTQWRDVVVADLNVDFTGTGYHARWQYHRRQGGDMLVRVEQGAPDGVLTGELLLVGGQVLLSRGFEGQGTDITPLMQAPLLMFQLANALLNHAEPKGPDAVGARRDWDVEEADRDFNLNTGFATGTFAAPWGVTGSGWKTDTGLRRFEIQFRFTNPEANDTGQNGSIGLSGELDFRKQGFPYPESTVLNGWQIQRFAIGEEDSKLVSDGLTLKALREEL